VAVGAAGIAAGAAYGRWQPREHDSGVIARAFERTTRQDECLGDHRSLELPLCRYGPPDAPADFIVWGDSMADAYMPAFEALALEMGRGGIHASLSSCPPVSGQPGRCGDFNELIAATIAELDIRTVVLAARWSAYPGSQLGATSLVPPGVEPWVLAEGPVFPVSPAVRFWAYPDEASMAASVPALQFPEGVNVVEVAGAFCDAQDCAYRSGGELLFRDAVHPSVAGALAMAGELDPALGSSANMR
jgi:hypothetical protein